MHNKGFTIIEVMIGLAIAVILTTVAYPSFISLIVENQLAAGSNSFVGSIAVARSEAIKRGQAVRLEALDASDNSNEWGPGWRIVVVTSSELIREYEALDNNATLNSVGDNGAYTFNSRGFITTAGDTLNLCHSSGDGSRQIQLLRSGSTSLIKGAGCTP
ncbi:GspH/FimT family pseudopilin [Zooshikella marina]|uniref:GspH/FimT family pseudopilin n=1 Tax=Zooshikella ganghwensis TaxID=202772 RepID=UPI001BB01B27|nr:GspH/FimT family pseudopilin [Zooshikella ganghwensis]MBU2706516.1 GspH/FimT family pseudopilin [Zooshikella ganghwensis]